MDQKQKKFLIIGIVAVVIVVIVLVAVFSNKGNKTNTTQKTNGSQTTITTTETKAEEKQAEQVNMGDTIDIEPLKMTLETFEIVPSYDFEYTEPLSIGGTHTKKDHIKPASGMQLVTLRGKLTNKTSKDVYTGNNFVKGEMIVNGNTYSTKLKCFNTEKAESFSTVSAQQEIEYFLYAEVPENVASNVESCVINFGCVEGLDASKYVSSVNALDYLYTLKAK